MRKVGKWTATAAVLSLLLAVSPVMSNAALANEQPAILVVHDIDPVVEATDYTSDDNVIWSGEYEGTLGDLLQQGVRANLTITANDTSTYTPNINIQISSPDTVPKAVYWVQAWGHCVEVSADESKDVTIVATSGKVGADEINVIVESGTTVNNEELGAANPVDIWNAGDNNAVTGLVNNYGDWKVEEVEIRAQGGAAAGQTDRLNWVEIGEERVYGNIQAAIDTAQPGDTVRVGRGTYEESVVISKALSLQGAGSDECTIIGQGSGYGGAVEVQEGVSGVVVAGLTIKGEGREAGVYLKGKNSQVTIRDNVIYAGSFGGKNAILTGGGQSDITIIGNTLISEQRSGQILYVNGEASLGSDNASSNVDIDTNTFEGVVGSGVVLGTEASGTISGNDFTGSGSTYARLEVWVDGVSVQGNVFGDTPEGTIQVRDNSGELDLGSVLQNNAFDRAVVVRNNLNEICIGKIFSSIQAAIDVAPENGIVQVAAGEYREGITVDKPLTLRGAKAGVDARDSGQRGGGESIINGYSADENYYVVYITADDVTVDGFTITNPLYSSTADASGVVIGSVGRNSNITVTNCIIHDIGCLDRPEVSFGSFGVNCGPVEGLTVTKNLIYNIKHQDNDAGDMAIGIFTWGNDEQDTTANVEISDNEIHNVSCPAFAAGISTGYYGRNIEVGGNNIHDVGGCGISTSSYALGSIGLKGNTVQRARTGIRIGFGETNIVGNNFIDNELQLDDESGAVDMSTVLEANTFNPAVVVRDADGEVYVHKIFSRIKDAVAAAGTGDTVEVGPGTYEESLIAIGKDGLTIAGAGRDYTTVDGKGANQVFFVEADGVTLQGMKIRNPGDPKAARYGVRVDGTVSDLAVDGCTFTNNSVGIKMATTSHVDGLTVTGCSFVDNTGPGIYQANEGKASTLHNLVVRSCTFVSNGDESGESGIYLEEVQGATIEGNVFDGNYWAGVYVYKAYTGSRETVQDVIIRGNTFKDAQRTAIIFCTLGSALTGQGVVIEGNTIVQDVGKFEQGNWGMIDVRLDSGCDHSPVLIKGNQVTFTGDFGDGPATAAYGIKLRGGLTDVTVTENILEGGEIEGGGSEPPFSGIWISTNDGSWGAIPEDACIRITRNTISGFVNGVTVYDPVARAYGGLADDDIVRLGFNAIVDNTRYALQGGSGGFVDAGFNYWGDNGPDLIKGVAGNVIVQPWLYMTPEEALAGNVSAYGYTVGLRKGWNTLSTPVVLAEPKLEDILPGGAEGVVLSFDEDQALWKQASWTDELQPLQGLYVRIVNPDLIQAVLRVSTDYTAPSTRPVKGGRWHLIGPSNAGFAAPIELNEALCGVKWAHVVSPAFQMEWDHATPQSAEGKGMWPFQAYWLYVPEDDNLPGLGNTPLMQPQDVWNSLFGED
ncbi:MAG TPA: hypothetical protein GX507_07575 [Clostridia bacterium]|nr:hypothetical protein [Clostridia bacterium]